MADDILVATDRVADNTTTAEVTVLSAEWLSQLVSAPTAAEIGQHEQEENESVFSDTSFPLDGRFAHHDTESSEYEADSSEDDEESDDEAEQSEGTDESHDVDSDEEETKDGASGYVRQQIQQYEASLVNTRPLKPR